LQAIFLLAHFLIVRTPDEQARIDRMFAQTRTALAHPLKLQET
jgi:hypothetical protein